MPDVSSLATPGVRQEKTRGNKGDNAPAGVVGLKALGVRDLSYRMAFLGCGVENTVQVEMTGGEIQFDTNCNHRIDQGISSIT